MDGGHERGFQRVESAILGDGETVEIVWLVGQCGSVETARELIARYREADLDAALKTVTDHWESLLGSIQVKTPDRAMELMLQRGFAARPDGGDALNVVTQDSSSGRTVVPR